ncbi:MAG: CoB--CoM heterodisulfide reductase iron-sulfur subunit A family protein [Bacteroidales bacterium]|jgi:heterodisulfide reductase subunit A|nr:FAD-dependent oxidoreductase [Bacteroidota bacterium]NLN99504.1 CoB--CoM heterodisulfide reductase iron-sulfur subunit A family protein [Bacteroidales bacterium]
MKNNVLIIGGGPAGMEASAQLQRLGYNVILIERESTLGGHLNRWDRLFPEGVPASEPLEALMKNMNGVKCFTDTEIQSINRLDKSFNVILSNGITVLADAVLIACGFDLFDASRKEEYGYGIYDHVITNADLEAWFQSKSDDRIDNPKRVGFVHCVGSRDEKAGCRGCSKVCCVTAVKEACEIKEAFPDAQVYCFYMDLRMFGRHYEDLYLKAQKDYGVRFIRGRVSEVSENQDRSLLVKAEDTLSSKPVQITLDLLVLMAGMRHSEAGRRIADMLNLAPEDDGFFAVRNNLTANQQARMPGLFLAGAATGPKTLPESLADARSAAAAIDHYLTDIFPQTRKLKKLVKKNG